MSPTGTGRVLAGASGPIEFDLVGDDLRRPECVLATAAGRLHVSDKRGGVTTIEPDGRQHLLGSSAMVPNGIALQRDGGFLVANLGPDGGVWRIDAQGSVQPWLLEFAGVRLPGVNFVTTDAQDRTWICVSANQTGDRYPLRERSGYILLHDRHGIRQVGGELGYTNELRLSADGRQLFVNETFARRTTRFALASDGCLRDRATVAEFEAGDFPDGLTLDAEGALWVVCVGSNRIYRITADGKRQTVIDDADPECVARLESAMQAGELTRPLLGAARGRHLANVTSLAFGGPDLCTAYLGCLGGSALVRFRSPVAGLRPDHWNWAGA
ncbi:SMP-30/gluconolactonase/LRE family protein [Piscinibacter sakaiensis]|uniref:SMP-30/gluconolactonase/LRE family protein n=1 Tax=Piscinibacter sakaiensis TaxID=1547922 RepID=UPI003AAF9FFC